MPRILLEDVTKRWNDFYGADHLDMEIEDKGFITLLGPSGCGKTTTLRMIAGLETPTSGRITIGDEVVLDSDQGINVPANKRHVGFLFQNYALWPHMTVYKNILFGLQNVNQEMPVHASEYERLLDMSRKVMEVDTIMSASNDSMGKDGKKDKDKEMLFLIDGLTISQYSAKEIMAMRLGEMDRASALDAAKSASDAYLEKAENEKRRIEEKGFTIDMTTFDLMKDGVVYTKKRRLDKEEMDLKLRHVARVVKIGEFMDRYPAELSGGQQQRVAIARTLAPGPKVLFMDEPLSNLDAKLRLEMRAELKRLHRETGATFVYVTHDQLEAMTLATRICLIRNGVIQQYDPPLKVYSKPNNLFVADFVGNPAMNFVQATAEMKEGRVEVKGLTGSLKGIFTPNEEGFSLEEEEREYLRLKKEREALKEERASEKGYVEKKNADTTFVPEIMTADGEEVVEGGKFYLGIRPEAVRVCSGKGIEAEVYAALPSGMETTVRLKVNDFILTSVVFGGVDYPVGSKVNIDFESDNILLFDRRDGRLVASGKLEIE